MDVIKTSLIIAIAITAYYLLMQWPQEPLNQISENYNSNNEIPINDSEYLQTKPASSLNDSPSLSAMSRIGEATEDNIDEPKGEIFTIENEDIFLEVDATSGKIFRSMFKDIKVSLGSESPLPLLGADGKNSYFANSGFINEEENSYIYPNFTNSFSTSNNDGSTTFTLTGENDGLFTTKEITLARSGYELSLIHI